MIVNYFFCSETNDIFLVECPGGKRTREVLEKIIVDHVEVGTKIITDGWKAYQHLEELGFYMFFFIKNHGNFIVTTQYSDTNQNYLRLFTIRLHLEFRQPRSALCRPGHRGSYQQN